MATRARVDTLGRAFAGSQRQIQTYVNEHPGRLTAHLTLSLNVRGYSVNSLSWVSPLARDNYREYRDGDFLRAVGLGQLETALNSFWPNRGPCWDALALIPGGCILVEAKSHIPEMYGNGCKAGAKCRPQIANALNRTKGWMGVPASADWLGPLYQSANRYATLYFLREIAHVEAYLANVYFSDDPRSPTTEPEWHSSFVEVARQMKLSTKAPFTCSVVLPALP